MKLDFPSRWRFDRLKDLQDMEPISLRELLGEKNEAYSQGIIELAFRPLR